MIPAERFYYDLIKEIGKKQFEEYVKEHDVEMYMCYGFISVDINGKRVLVIPPKEYVKHKDVYIYCVFNMIRVFANRKEVKS